MPADIRVQVDDNLKEEATALFAELGMTLDEAIRVFLRRSVRERGLPFPMQRMSEMEMAAAGANISTKSRMHFRAVAEAFDEKTRSDLNSVLDHLENEINQFFSRGKTDSRLTVDEHFALVLSPCNVELKRISEHLQISIEQVHLAFNEVNDSIDRVRIGETKLFPDGNVDFVAALCRSIVEELVISIARTRRLYEKSPLPCGAFRETVHLLSEIEDHYRTIYGQINAFAEKIAIRDALTEESIQDIGNAELDRL